MGKPKKRRVHSLGRDPVGLQVTLLDGELVYVNLKTGWYYEFTLHKLNGRNTRGLENATLPGQRIPVFRDPATNLYYELDFTVGSSATEVDDYALVSHND